MQKKAFCLDIGKTRVGIAYSDEMGILSSPFKTINLNNLHQELENICSHYTITKLIVGLPLNKDGSRSEQTEITEDIINKIKIAFPQLNIIQEDEKFSSKEALQRLEQRGIKISKDNKSLIDMEAAAIILEQYWQQQSTISLIDSDIYDYEDDDN